MGGQVDRCLAWVHADHVRELHNLGLDGGTNAEYPCRLQPKIIFISFLFFLSAKRDRAISDSDEGKKGSRPSI